MESLKTIWKYNLNFVEKQELEIPLGGKILKILTQYDTQHYKIAMWVEVDPNEILTVTRTFMVYGTGQSISEENIKYIDTVSLHEGRLIYHVYEKDNT